MHFLKKRDKETTQKEVHDPENGMFYNIISLLRGEQGHKGIEGHKGALNIHYIWNLQSAWNFCCNSPLGMMT